MSTVILGGGIIGLSTAYYLSLARASSSSSSTSIIHIVDSAPSLLLSASGFAGGFLAADWFSPSVAALGALSFRLHRELAEKHSGSRRWGYAGSHTYNLSVDERAAARKGRKGKGEDWLREGTSRAEAAAGAGSVSSEANGGSGGRQGDMLNPDGSPAVWTPQPGGTLETMSGPETTAQIEPRELCEFLLDECKKRGVQVRLSTEATGIITNEDGALRAIKLQSVTSSTTEEVNASDELECKDILISAGAWTPRVFKTLFPQSKLQVPIEPLAGHSLVVKSPRYKTPFIDAAKRNLGGGAENWLCYAIYCSPSRHWSYATEAFARLARNGETEIWLGGLNDGSLPLPELASDVKAMIDPESIKSLRRTTMQLTGLANEGDEVNQDDLETVREGLCFRPVSQRGVPVLGKIPDHYLGLRPGAGGGSVWIASGHGPWGISLSLGTGMVMSEMISGEKPSADIRALLIA
ncbi:uncharacterized protein Z520_03444 [Fonsecaea multimorphosa CBS 102226]|uniref:FAD dependent oxidoreductase domain-containing protein n=1 Tax=Fonsecaea multimorphosa CBS 102226 TaxID=1442371 RepID=A0A0D2KVJ3_9EURO|nr:uncharacterized protein Z520_03444 [Fonsecaea multimorphosa CBS 102226]KIY00779.1 hypothetical protein Z520_03444 [Fonsecaea multimorphosa CBS 102226]OAL27878.1 hypothetical protein AYO22_03223 [Fonsecaea multimorphosa]